MDLSGARPRHWTREFLSLTVILMAKAKTNFSIAKNPSTPVEILKLLAKDKDEAVRSDVASNPSTPKDTLTF